jgi:Ca2+-binding RTX toxin-like protein
MQLSCITFACEELTANKKTIKGTPMGDWLFGTVTSDIIDGLRGDDYVLGFEGSDNLNGAAGSDTLYGGLGNDRVTGGTDNDMLDGDKGNDRLTGGERNDSLYGGDDNDLLNGDNGNDYLDGGKGADKLNGGNGNDRLNSGTDDVAGVLNGGAGTSVAGSKGDDSFYVYGVSGAVSGGATIADFGGKDRILVQDLGSSTATLDRANFLIIGADPVATSAQGQFLYDTDDGRLYLDRDGTGTLWRRNSSSPSPTRRR